MTTTLKYAGLAVAGIVVGLLLSALAGLTTQRSPLGGVYNAVTNVFSDGIVPGDRGMFFKSGTIGPGVNQNAYLNNTGKTLLIQAADVNIGWTSGTATSSGLFYVSTSTGSTVTDYARPSASYLLIDGANFATSTLPPASLVTGTSTANGKGAVFLQPGETLIFNYQERYGCKANALCEMATSTNRGIQQFFWNFKATYLYQ